MMDEEGRRKLGLCGLEKMVKGVSPPLFNTPASAYREDGAKLFSRVGQEEQAEIVAEKTGHVKKLLPHENGQGLEELVQRDEALLYGTCTTSRAPLEHSCIFKTDLDKAQSKRACSLGIAELLLYPHIVAGPRLPGFSWRRSRARPCAKLSAGSNVA